MNTNKKDRIISKLEHIINRWIDVPQTVYFIDRESSVKPRLISITYKEEDNERITITNGCPVDDGGRDEESGVSIYAMIGDSRNGYGGSRAARDVDVPRDPNSIANLVENLMDTTLKVAFKSYLGNISDNIGVKDGNGFIKLSTDDIYVDIRQKPPLLQLNRDTINELKRWGKQMSKKRYVEETSCEVVSKRGSRRFVDSEGRKLYDSNRYSLISVAAVVRHELGFQIGYGGQIISMDNQVKASKLNGLLEGLSDYCERLVTAETPPSNQYPVLFNGSAIGTIFHEALGGHLLSGKYIQNGDSTTFKGKIGQKIMPEFISIIDNPQLAGSHGYYVYDDEGIKATAIHLVENGILKNYLLDRSSAAKMGISSNGHSRMEWVGEPDPITGVANAVCPEPRVSNLEIVSSKTIPEPELFETMKRYCHDNHIEYGVYVEGGSGSVELETSEFRFSPERAWKVYPDGRKKEITNFFIVGKPFEILSQIESTSDRYSSSHKMCGALSGDVPTMDLAPSAFIPRITIQSQEPTLFTERLLEREWHR